MFSNNQIPRHNNCLSCSTSSKKDSEEEEEALVEEEDEVMDLSSVTIVGYSDITRGIAHNYSVHVDIAPQLITLSRTVHK